MWLSAFRYSLLRNVRKKTAGQDQRSHWSNHASSADICSAHCHLNFEEKVEENACFWPDRIISEYFVKMGAFSHDSTKTVALSKKTNFTVVLRILTEVSILCSGVFLRGMFWLRQGSPVGEKSCCLVRDDS